MQIDKGGEMVKRWYLKLMYPQLLLMGMCLGEATNIKNGEGNIDKLLVFMGILAVITIVKVGWDIE